MLMFVQGLGFTEYVEDVKSVYQEYKVQAAVREIPLYPHVC